MRPEFQIKVAGGEVTLGKRTLIMGVLNVTPDSFSDGGRYLVPARAIQHGVDLARQGADWIDVGGESTRPGSQPVPEEEELRRVLPVIRGLRKKLPSIPISIDTTKAAVAEEALRAGASILNDVSGLRFDSRVADVAFRYGAPLILMHLRGRPATMQQGAFARDIWRSLREGLEASIRRARAAGVKRSQIIIDPGLGFGKTRRQNYQILVGLDKLRRFGLPILVGTSRKSFVQAVVAGEGLGPSSAGQLKRQTWPVRGRKSTLTAAQSALLVVGDAAVVAAAILGGAHIIRTHEPGAILPAVRIADALASCKAPSSERTS
jgi:dihydropteroate synthase